MAVPTVAAFPWLIPQRMPGEALAQGVQAGAAIAAARLRSAELRAERDRVVLAQAKMMADQANELALREGFAAMGAFHAQVARQKAWNQPWAKQGFWELAAQYPDATRDPAFKLFQESFDRAQDAEDKLAFEKWKMGQEALQPTTDIKNIREQARLKFGETESPEARSFMRQSVIDLGKTALQKNVEARVMSEFGTLESPEAKQLFQELLDASFMGPSEVLEMTPSGLTRRTGAAAKGGITTATQAQAEQRLSAFEKVNNMIEGVLQSVRPENVGVRGQFQTVVVDRGLAQLFPELADRQNIDVQTLGKLLNQHMMRALRADAQVNVKEEQRILGALPAWDTTKAWMESYPDVLGKLRRVQKEVGQMYRVDARTLKQQAPEWALSPEEIIARKDQLGPAKAEELLMKYHADWLQQFK